MMKARQEAHDAAINIPSDDFAVKYAKDRTDEVTKLERLTITRTVFNRDRVITFYTKVEHVYGGVFYFKNGDDISEWQYNHETR
jgi:hypothetical protein